MPASVVSLTTSNLVASPSAGRSRTSCRSRSSSSGGINRVALTQARIDSTMSTTRPVADSYESRSRIATVSFASV